MGVVILLDFGYSSFVGFLPLFEDFSHVKYCVSLIAFLALFFLLISRSYYVSATLLYLTECLSLEHLRGLSLESHICMFKFRKDNNEKKTPVRKE